MRSMFAVLGILLILSGVIVLGAPLVAERTGISIQSQKDRTRSFDGAPSGDAEHLSLIDQVRQVAEKANAPLSILFGFMSLYYTRRGYYERRSR